MVHRPPSIRTLTGILCRFDINGLARIYPLTNTNLLDFLRTRRSIRRFKPDPVPDSVIRELLHTATFAPSAHNRQP
ncbi:MAG: hypothetical protein DPW18_12075 [Chloroflexi bacterium]|nr:hypothetical protein [Chloroflexota bacterium]